MGTMYEDRVWNGLGVSAERRYRHPKWRRKCCVDWAKL